MEAELVAGSLGDCTVMLALTDHYRGRLHFGWYGILNSPAHA